MFRISTQLLFACLLLLSQTALVSHDVQHLSSGHNELCSVYISQDHSAHNVGVVVPAVFNVSPESGQVDAVDIFSRVSISVYDSRGPPKTIFFS